MHLKETAAKHESTGNIISTMGKNSMTEQGLNASIKLKQNDGAANNGAGKLKRKAVMN